MNRILLLICALFSLEIAHCQLGTTSFNFTGTVQTYTVPACVTQLQVFVRGAKGGGPNGGYGSTLTGIMDVTPGQILEVRVGGQGGLGTNSGGFNGGGTGHPGGPESGGGGGASDIRVAPYSLNDRFVVAGGGGGRGGGASAVGGGIANCPNGDTGTGSFGGPGEGGTQLSGGNGGGPWGGGNGGRWVLSVKELRVLLTLALPWLRVVGEVVVISEVAVAVLTAVVRELTEVAVVERAPVLFLPASTVQQVLAQEISTMVSSQ